MSLATSVTATWTTRPPGEALGMDLEKKQQKRAKLGKFQKMELLDMIFSNILIGLLDCFC